MKLIIEGKISKEDFIKIGKFFREMWKDREDVLGIFVTEGTENMSKEDCMKMLKEIFDEGGYFGEIEL